MNVRQGDRVRIVGIMPNDPDPIPVGMEGTVEEVVPEVGQIWVDWDEDTEGRKRSLILLMNDPFEVVR
jgi:Domain of unknown function (DUF4314)